MWSDRPTTTNWCSGRKSLELYVELEDPDEPPSEHTSRVQRSVVLNLAGVTFMVTMFAVTLAVRGDFSLWLTLVAAACVAATFYGLRALKRARP